MLAHHVNNCVDKQMKHKVIQDDLNSQDFMKTARASERATHQMNDLEGQASANKVCRNRG